MMNLPSPAPSRFQLHPKPRSNLSSPSTTYQLPHTAHHIPTTLIFNNIPALNSQVSLFSIAFPLCLGLWKPGPLFSWTFPLRCCVFKKSSYFFASVQQTSCPNGESPFPSPWPLSLAPETQVQSFFPTYHIPHTTYRLQHTNYLLTTEGDELRRRSSMEKEGSHKAARTCAPAIHYSSLQSSKCQQTTSLFILTATWMSKPSATISENYLTRSVSVWFAVVL
jgi:hypothetical protein